MSGATFTRRSAMPGREAWPVPSVDADPNGELIFSAVEHT